MAWRLPAEPRRSAVSFIGLFSCLWEETNMKTYARTFLAASLLTVSASAFAQTGGPSGAVNISIGSTGGALDDAALRTVRQVVGHAVASGAVDTFLVYSPRAGSPVPIEGGLSACAEAGFNIPGDTFDLFVQDLSSIRPQEGTFYNLVRAESCSRDENIACTQDAQRCPDGSYVGRVPPTCDFAPCPGE
jgi:hypothetical protein